MNLVQMLMISSLVEQRKSNPESVKPPETQVTDATSAAGVAVVEAAILNLNTKHEGLAEKIGAGAVDKDGDPLSGSYFDATADLPLLIFLTSCPPCADGAVEAMLRTADVYGLLYKDGEGTATRADTGEAIKFKMDTLLPSEPVVVSFEHSGARVTVLTFSKKGDDTMPYYGQCINEIMEKVQGIFDIEHIVLRELSEVPCNPKKQTPAEPEAKEEVEEVVAEQN